MKKTMDKLKSKIRISKRFTIFLFVLMLVGVIAGSLFITILSSSDKTLVKEYLGQYMEMTKSGKVNYFSVFINSIMGNGLTAVGIWLLGISIVGIPVILFLFFCKTFTLGFSVGSLLFVYNWKGALLSFIYVFPHQVMNLFAYGLLVIYALSVSIKMIEAVFKKKTIDFKTIMGKYSIVLGITIGLFILSAVYETFAMPQVLKWIWSIIS